MSSISSFESEIERLLSVYSPRRGRAHGRCCTEVPQSHSDLAPKSAHH